MVWRSLSDLEMASDPLYQFHFLLLGQGRTIRIRAWHKSDTLEHERRRLAPTPFK